MPEADYSALVIDHFDRPRNAGRFAPGVNVIESTAGRPDQGAMFHLSALTSGEILMTVRFEAHGCPHCIAAASWLTEHLKGCTRDELAAWSWREVAEVLQIPAEKRGRLLVLEDAVRRLAAAWRV
jgi:NifU-like protein involved in Fe-S cluster formation